MILTCPSCGTQYVVKDGAIPPEGRQVRCASCKHSWHQDPDDVLEADAPQSSLDSEEPAPREADLPPDDADDSDESIAEATLIEPRSGPEAEERAFESAELESGDGGDLSETAIEAPEPVETDAATDWQEPPEAEAQDDRFNPFRAPEATTSDRRSPVAAIFVVVLIIVAAAAAFWFLAPPEWKARLGLAELGTSPLALVTTHMDRQQLASGNELLTVTGRVINPTAKEQSVPPMTALLKTRAGKVVYSWTIAPPARSLAPGASASFNSAEVNVPPGGDELTITLGTQAG